MLKKKERKYNFRGGKKEMAEKIKMSITPKVDLLNLMAQANAEMKCVGVAFGFQIAQGCLIRIVKRAIEIKDEPILEELKTLCLVKEINEK